MEYVVALTLLLLIWELESKKKKRLTYVLPALAFKRVNCLSQCLILFRSPPTFGSPYRATRPPEVPMSRWYCGRTCNCRWLVGTTSTAFRYRRARSRCWLLIFYTLILNFHFTCFFLKIHHLNERKKRSRLW